MVNVEPYGGGLWHTWFDRDLTVAGCVLVREGDQLTHRLVRLLVWQYPSLASAAAAAGPARHACDWFAPQHVQACCAAPAASLAAGIHSPAVTSHPSAQPAPPEPLLCAAQQLCSLCS